MTQVLSPLPPKEGRPEPKPTTPKGIPIETLIEYRSRNLTHKEIGQLLGIARETVSRRLGKVDLEGLDRFKKNEADVLAFTKRRLLSAVTDAKLKKTSARDLIVSYGIIDDKEDRKRNGSDNKNSISIILNLACQSNEKVIEIKAENVDKQT